MAEVNRNTTQAADQFIARILTERFLIQWLEKRNAELHAVALELLEKYQGATAAIIADRCGCGRSDRNYDPLNAEIAAYKAHINLIAPEVK